jgi:hypothetical protein
MSELNPYMVRAFVAELELCAYENALSDERKLKTESPLENKLRMVQEHRDMLELKLAMACDLITSLGVPDSEMEFLEREYE